MASVASGCGAPQESTTIERLLDPLLLPPTGYQPPQATQARAFSLFAAIFMEFCLYPGEERGFSKEMFFLMARFYADRAAQLGLVSEAAIEIAESSALPEDVHPLAKFTALKAAYDDYRAEVERLSRPVAEWFPCSAGCGIEASKLSGLYRCSGQCTPDLKPRYCSKECQRLVRYLLSSVLPYVYEGLQDWKRHRRVCRGDATAADVAALPPPVYSMDAEDSLRVTPDEILADSRTFASFLRHTRPSLLEVKLTQESATVRWKVEYSIDIPLSPSGGVQRMYSTTATPTQMKLVRRTAHRAGPSWCVFLPLGLLCGVTHSRDADRKYEGGSLFLGLGDIHGVGNK